MKKKLQVFVSSTWEDMRVERQAAVEAILTAKHIPAGMELFAAGDQSQWDVIRRWIDDSDVFVLILGGRYGSINPDTKESYIHGEYRHALEAGKPLFAVYMSKEMLDRKVRDHGSAVLERDHPDKFTKFEKVVLSKMCRRFDNLDQLKLAVMQSLAHIEDEYGPSLKGWVRGDEAVDPKALIDQISRLQTENEKLRQLGAVSPFSRPDSIALQLTREATAFLLHLSEYGPTGYTHDQFGEVGLVVSGKMFVYHPGQGNQKQWVQISGVITELKQLELVTRDDDSSLATITRLGYQVAALLPQEAIGTPFAVEDKHTRKLVLV